MLENLTVVFQIVILFLKSQCTGTLEIRSFQWIMLDSNHLYLVTLLKIAAILQQKNI